MPPHERREASQAPASFVKAVCFAEDTARSQGFFLYPYELPGLTRVELAQGMPSQARYVSYIPNHQNPGSHRSWWCRSCARLLYVWVHAQSLYKVPLFLFLTPCPSRMVPRVQLCAALQLRQTCPAARPTNRRGPLHIASVMALASL